MARGLKHTDHTRLPGETHPLIYSERIALKLTSGVDSGSRLYTAASRTVVKRISGLWNSAPSLAQFDLYIKPGGLGGGFFVYSAIATGALNQPINEELRIVLDVTDQLWQYHSPAAATIQYQLSGFVFTS